MSKNTEKGIYVCIIYSCVYYMSILITISIFMTLIWPFCVVSDAFLHKPSSQNTAKIHLIVGPDEKKTYINNQVLAGVRYDCMHWLS